VIRLTSFCEFTFLHSSFSPSPRATPRGYPPLGASAGLIGGALFGCGGVAWALYFKGVFAALLSRPDSIELSMWLYGLIARPLLFFGVFLFVAGAVVFSLLPGKTSNQSLEPTAGRRNAHI
jgi:hypothetical protein